MAEAVWKQAFKGGPAEETEGPSGHRAGRDRCTEDMMVRTPGATWAAGGLEEETPDRERLAIDSPHSGWERYAWTQSAVGWGWHERDLTRCASGTSGFHLGNWTGD